MYRNGAGGALPPFNPMNLPPPPPFNPMNLPPPPPGSPHSAAVSLMRIPPPPPGSPHRPAVFSQPLPTPSSSQFASRGGGYQRNVSSMVATRSDIPVPAVPRESAKQLRKTHSARSRPTIPMDPGENPRRALTMERGPPPIFSNTTSSSTHFSPSLSAIRDDPRYGGAAAAAYHSQPRFNGDADPRYGGATTAAYHRYADRRTVDRRDDAAMFAPSPRIPFASDSPFTSPLSPLSRDRPSYPLSPVSRDRYTSVPPSYPLSPGAADRHSQGNWLNFVAVDDAYSRGAPARPTLRREDSENSLRRRRPSYDYARDGDISSPRLHRHNSLRTRSGRRISRTGSPTQFSPRHAYNERGLSRSTSQRANLARGTSRRHEAHQEVNPPKAPYSGWFTYKDPNHQGILRSWKKAFVVLDEDLCRFFNKEDRKKCLEAFPIDENFVCHGPREAHRSPFVFQIKVKSDLKGHNFLVKAISPEDGHMWLWELSQRGAKVFPKKYTREM